MHIRIVNFSLAIPREEYIRRATAVAPAFAEWPGLLAKWGLGDESSGAYGGVYLFASREDADRSRDTELFRSIFTNPALRDVTVDEYDVLDGLSAVTAPELLVAQ